MAVKATISVVSTMPHSVTLRIAVGSGYTSYRVLVRTGPASGTGVTVYDDTFAGAAPFRVIVDGLVPETTYSCNVCSISAAGSEWDRTVEFTTPSARPPKGSWRSDIRPEAVLAHAANGKLLSVISRGEWVAFCENINAVRGYMGYSAYSFTAPVSGTTALDAAIVNETVEAIGEMNPPVVTPAKVEAGSTPMSAAFFNGLEDALNSIS